MTLSSNNIKCLNFSQQVNFTKFLPQIRNLDLEGLGKRVGLVQWVCDQWGSPI